MANEENKIEAVPQAPSKVAQILHVGKIIAIALVAISGTLMGLQVEGVIAIPQSILGVLTAIAGIGAALGIASKGTEKPKPDELK